IGALAFSPDDKTLASGGGSFADDKEVRTWKLEKNQLLAVYQMKTGQVNSLSWDSEGELLAIATLRGGPRVWSKRSGKEVVHLSIGEGNDNVCLVAAFAKDGKTLISGWDDGSIVLWKTGEWNKPTNLAKHERPVIALAYSPCGKEFFSLSRDGVVKIWT